MDDSPPGRDDRLFLQAVGAWAGPDPTPYLAPPWRGRIAAPSCGLAEGPEAIRRLLRDEHAADLRPDLDRVHPSWCRRALQGESSTVVRAAVAGAPGPLRDRLREELGLSDDDLKPSGAAHPEALACLSALWTEPFVGGPPPGGDDPPIVAAIGGLPRGELTRLLSLAGLAKAAASGGAGAVAPPARIAARLEAFRAEWGDLEGPLRRLAAEDVARQGGADIAHLPRIGLVTAARLLAGAEPHRARWAMQHLPYPTARFVRAEMDREPPPGLMGDAIWTWEGRVLAMARDRFDAEREPPGGAA